MDPRAHSCVDRHHGVTGLPNVTTLTYDRNRLTQLNGVAWSYDFQGNLTGDGAYTYQWDARNRLTQIRQGGTPVATFSYDAFNRRTTRTVSGSATEYLHDGLTPIQEKVGTNATQLVTGPGIDDYLARIEPTKTRYYLTDFLGSTVALANESGSLVTSYTYEPYGETTATGEPSGNPFQFTGRENDQTGLYFYRARYYHPVAKRFISEDPIGQACGVNVSAYVRGNPISRRDPRGLYPGSSPEENNTVYDRGFERDFRAPDYIQISGDIYVANGSATLSRSGNVFAGGGLTKTWGNPYKLGWSISLGWLSQCKEPAPQAVDDFVGGLGMGFAGFYSGVGGGVAWSPQSGTAMQFGVGAGTSFNPVTAQGNVFSTNLSW